MRFLICGALFAAALFVQGEQRPKSLEGQLRAIGARKLVAEARAKGDAQRGAVVFYQRQLQCTRCHVPDNETHRLGPDLTALGKDASDEHLVESVLDPSKTVRKGFETWVAESGDDSVTGFLVSQDEREVVLRDAAKDFKRVRFARKDLRDFYQAHGSAMPSGLTNMLTSKQQFVDLVRYLIEIRDGGSKRARALEPDPSLYADRPLPAYEKTLDHRGFIQGLDDAAFGRGRAIYERLCINCHGTKDEPGSLPTSLRFATGEFKNGSDPHSMYETLTRGFGMMTAQTWMVPSQKYDVIHYVREAYLKPHNPSQYFQVDEAYLARLPKGKSRGPKPSKTQAWTQMDYGPNQALTLEVGKGAKNVAYKGHALRLDAGPGGVAKGGYWMLFDADTMRMAAAWQGEGFIDWKNIHFDGKHGVHPRVVGDVHLSIATGPGWASPEGSFVDNRLVGRDERRYGPLPRPWAQFRGMYYHGAETLLEYTVGSTNVLERPAVQITQGAAIYRRVFEIGPREQPLVLLAAQRDEKAARFELVDGVAVFGVEAPKALAKAEVAEREPSSGAGGLAFDGKTRLECNAIGGLNVRDGDFTLTARIRTKKDGSIAAMTEPKAKWVPDGLTWFVRGGRLALDIGWVGAVHGKQRVADGRWHDVAVSYSSETGAIAFFVDGKRDGPGGRLQRKKPLQKAVLRIGYTANNFPGRSYWQGDLRDLRFYNRVLEPNALDADRAQAHWPLATLRGKRTLSVRGKKRPARLARGRGQADTPVGPQGWTVLGLVGDDQGCSWKREGEDLRLVIPAGKESRRLALWFTSVPRRADVAGAVDSVVIDEPREDLRAKTNGGPARWPHVLQSDAILGRSDGPFEVDVFKRPIDNPWFCRMRLTGFDFADDGDSMIASSWDGSIWKISGLRALPKDAAEGAKLSLSWRRIASGLFQPLGVKLVDGKIYVTCRDQLALLHDKNGDAEIDHIECFNGDHQVTDHFHEFAMGLQVDREGNFFYAKSARHGLPALVPHHGTLLRVSKDGQRTDILATGFRAANGVCINPDGTYIVTDQEGHWNPKNRINYVKEGGFYGNMYGYHDVSDSSDSAMEQPLVWITNKFDRSPGELLWVDSERWGPLNKRLLNLSYGYGMVYIVPHEKIGGQAQGGMCAFPIKRFPTGVMRGRFHAHDGQLYLAGMFAWAGSQQQPGGLYRLRYTGRPVHLPVELEATKRGIRLKLAGRLDRKTATDVSRYTVKVWRLERTKRYGSKHFDERELRVQRVRLDDDACTLHLDIEGIAPTWCMEIKYDLRSEDGTRIRNKIHNTIHRLGD